MNALIDTQTLRGCIQKVATGPEYSKDLSYEETLEAMDSILSGTADPVQTAIFFISLRMKRETDAENKGVVQGIIDKTDRVEAPVDELVDIADPYDGFIKGLPCAPFLPAVLAACGVAAISHGLESVGPKHGVTHRQILRSAGINVDLTPVEAAMRLGVTGLGWAYLDQSQYCTPLHDLVGIRERIVKRQVLTTVEKLVRPISGRQKTHLLTGYVHKAYPPMYAELARFAGFDSALIVRGAEGGVTPSLQQIGKVFAYQDRGAEQLSEIDPKSLGIEQSTRSTPIPQNIDATDTQMLAQLAAEAGLAALNGQSGPSYDSLVYTGALTLAHLRRYDSLPAAANAVRGVLNSGAALAHFQAGR